MAARPVVGHDQAVLANNVVDMEKKEAGDQ